MTDSPLIVIIIVLPGAGAAPAPDEPEPVADAGLSVRDRQILARLAGGACNKSIARDLELAENTIKSRMKILFRRIGVANRTQAALWALKNRVSDEK
jgi:two-component system nitrate/nitrite response regulator NarL